MALTGLIPIGRTPVDYLTEGTKGFNDIFNRIRQAGLEQQKINDMVNYHKSSIGLQGAAGERAQAMLGPQLQALQDAHLMNELKYNPEAQSNYFQKMMEMISGQQMPMDGQNPQDQGMPNRQAAPGWGGDVGDMQNPDGTWNGGTMENNPMATQQQAPSQTAPKPQMNLQELAKNPMARMMLKHMGLDLDAMNREMPEQKMQRDLMTNQAKLQQKSEESQKAERAKERKSIEKEIPVHYKKLQEVQELKKLIKKHPDWFGAGVLGFDFLGGPNQRKRGITDSDYGKIETLLGGLIGPQAQEFSSKGLASALNLAKEIKPGFGENANIALGKLLQIEKRLQQSLKEDKEKLYPKNSAASNNESQASKDPLGLGI